MLFLLKILEIQKHCKTFSGKICQFPFKYKGKTYDKCTQDHTGLGTFWCATAVDESRNMIDKEWGNCVDPLCKSKFD